MLANDYVIAASFANHGTRRLIDAQSKITDFYGWPGCGLSEWGEEYFGTIPANGKCIDKTGLYTLIVLDNAPDGFIATLAFRIESKYCYSSDYTIYFQVVK
jgi:hypothetical protein